MSSHYNSSGEHSDKNARRCWALGDVWRPRPSVRRTCRWEASRVGPGQAAARVEMAGKLRKFILNIGTTSKVNKMFRKNLWEVKLSDSKCCPAPNTKPQNSKLSFTQECCGFSSKQQSTLLGKSKKQKSRRKPFQLVFKWHELLASKTWMGIFKKKSLDDVGTDQLEKRNVFRKKSTQNFKTEVKMEQAEAWCSKGKKRQR